MRSTGLAALAPACVAAFALACVVVSTFAPAQADECSTAVISGAAGVDGAPHSYLGLVDADDASGRRVYVGLNDAGLAIMNTVAYNLPGASGEAADLEGTIMADALRLCATVDDFEKYIRENIGPGLGSQANFGVIDAAGGAAVFEVYNKGCERLDAAVAPERYILVTNFSRSGKEGAGRGYVRFDRLTELFRGDEDGKFSFDQILETFARDMRNPYLSALEPPRRAKLPADKSRLVHTQHTIDRGCTAAAAVIHGAAGGADPRSATMWVILGEPVCGIAVPLWVEAGEVPLELRGEQVAPINQESMRLKAILRPYEDDERIEYADLSKLGSGDGTGWLSVLVRKEKDIIERTSRFLATNPDRAAKARFQREVAAEALEALKAVK
jgi:hypothetical protein